MRHIAIYLGSKCNMNCKYCHREEDTTEQSVVSDKLLKFLTTGDQDQYIRFMGGEPTLYFDAIKTIVDAVPTANFAITTNGKDIAKYIDYFREHNFTLCISYDGADNDLRGYDPFTELIDYPFIQISTTIYHGNTDLKKIIRKLIEKEVIIGRYLHLFPHIMHYTSTSNKQYALTREDAMEYISQFKKMVGKYMHDYYVYGVINTRYQSMFYQLYRAYNAHYSLGETYCVKHNQYKVDLKGNFFDCLYIRDHQLPDTYTDSEKQLEYIRSKFPKCLNCEVYSMCGAACVKSKEHDIECMIYYTLFTWFKKEYEKWSARYGDYREPIHFR